MSNFMPNLARNLACIYWCVLLALSQMSHLLLLLALHSPRNRALCDEDQTKLHCSPVTGTLADLTEEISTCALFPVIRLMLLFGGYRKIDLYIWSTHGACWKTYPWSKILCCQPLKMSECLMLKSLPKPDCHPHPCIFRLRVEHYTFQVT